MMYRKKCIYLFFVLLLFGQNCFAVKTKSNKTKNTTSPKSKSLTKRILSRINKFCLWDIAVHEAGHATAAKQNGGHVISVSIRENNNSKGRTTICNLSERNRINMTLAGYIAEKIINNKKYNLAKNTTTDIQSAIKDIINTYNLDPNETMKIKKKLLEHIEETNKLVHNNSKFIKALAEHLVDKRELNEEEFKSFYLNYQEIQQTLNQTN